MSKTNLIMSKPNLTMSKTNLTMSKPTPNATQLSGTYQEIAKKYIKKLDYTIDNTADRLVKIQQIIIKNDNLLVDYFDNKYKSFKSPGKGDLSDQDPICSALSDLTDYLLYQDKKERRRLNDAQKNKNKHEEKTDNPEEHKNVLDSKKSQGEYYQIANFQTKIDEADLQKYSELRQLQDARDYLLVKVRKCAPIHRWKYNKFKNYILNDMKIIKESLSGMISFNAPDFYSTKYDFDCDTGYFDKNGDYVLVSENKVDFGDRKHLIGIVSVYNDIRAVRNPDSDVKYITDVFNEIVWKTKLNKEFKLLLKSKQENKTNEEISNILNDNGYISNPPRVSILYRILIDKFIEAWEAWREDWIYTFKVKGNWKTCIGCSEIKLANERYFSPDSRNLDGWHSFCKKCR